MDTTNATHLHADDYPATVKLLRQIERPGIGFAWSEYGLWVDWDRVEESNLSTTEKATARIARGLATLERSGGAGPLDRPIVNAVRKVLE